ncbi:hypothetical protein V5O48_005861 [Marasmius crinis-equi]|uniref:Uncharacterized protein n=1 Tax=Marasmius crinis-equi TaxID=585013 RepID=A0ABR3FL75_9AGAR
MVDDSLVVHLYSNFEGLSTGPHASSTQVLQDGRELVKQTLEGSRWSRVSVVCDKKWAPGLVTTGHNVYVYPNPPSILEAARKQASAELPGCEQGGRIQEWGTPANETEAFSMNDLSEFQSTNIDDIFNVEDAAPDVGESVRSEIEGTLPEEHLDRSPLYKIFPQPHFHTFGDAEVNIPSELRPYTTTEPISIPPHTLDTLSSFPNRRRAWLVPVRGVLPWEGTTQATVLDPNISPQRPRSPNPETALPIVWTHASLLALWTSLLGLNGIGRIGIAFTAAGSESLQLLNPSLRPLMHPPDTGDRDDESAASRSRDRRSSQNNRPVNRNPLDSVDYIKVYHSSQVSMHLRAVLDLFTFEIDGGDADANKEMAIRVLKGARLTLMDELSRGVLIS